MIFVFQEWFLCNLYINFILAKMGRTYPFDDVNDMVVACIINKNRHLCKHFILKLSKVIAIDGIQILLGL